MRAAQYLRMSTDRQAGSPANQAAVIGAYAQARGYEIVRSFEDAGASGVSLRARPAFQAMLAAVLAGLADYEVILVYDVSRFGRFQDPDEAAHYEWLCRSEGVAIEYCAEGFDSGGPGAALHKGLKRAMAAEFSRELGEKVRHAQRRLAGEGHWQHGSPGYGLRRRIVRASGALGPILEAGQRKHDPSEHTVLVAGPRAETTIVRRMFARCAKGGLTPAAIARELNAEGRAGPTGGSWSSRQVRTILTHRKYSGELITHQRRTPLGGRREPTPPAEWVRVLRGAPRLISPGLFEAAQSILRQQAPPSDEGLLESLRDLTECHGVVSEPKLMALGLRSYRSYRRRFGSLRSAYGLIGYTTPEHQQRKMDEAGMLRGLAKLFLREGDLSKRLIDADPAIPSADHYRVRFGSMARAYGAVGFVRLSKADLISPVGQARQAARETWVRAWAEGRVP